MTAARASVSRHRHFPLFPKRLFIEQAQFGLLCWALFSLVMLVIPIGVSWFRPIDSSGWSIVQQVLNWYVLVIGVHLGWSGFAQYVTHGQSRRTYLQSAGVFILAFALLAAVLSAVTFLPEALIYATAGWPQTVHEGQLYDNVLNVPMVVIQHWLTYVLWMSAGLALGIGWYRGTLTGSIAILLSLAMGGLGNLSMCRTEGPLGFIVREGFLPQEPQLWLALLVHLGGAAVLFAFSLRVGRDVPIHKKEA